MPEPLITHGMVYGLDKNPSFCTITDGYFTIKAFLPSGVTVQVGSTYQVYKQGSTYYVGQELK